ncbi:MAG: hypothetical protein GY862_23000 [Gammaproteobacteria bacterium]|nr:hypothetical protein [Gammaproteobacteria bacterium]
MLTSLLEDRHFDLKLLQPESSVAFAGFGPLGGGWGGVYRWCRQAAERNNGILPDDPLFRRYDLLILHLDADVAGKNYAQANIDDWPEEDLPCEEDCPPPRTTTDALRRILLSWMRQANTPPGTVLCTPSKSTEAWVMPALFPGDKEMARTGWECYPNPARRLSRQSKKKRLQKSENDYEKQKEAVQARWPAIENQLSEARRFADDIRNLLL